MAVPEDIAAKVQFFSDRTCCVCREKGKPVQIHHIDGDETNNDDSNLAVLCLDCHHETQIRGGFARKLDAEQIKLYRDNWYSIVSSKRAGLLKSSVVQSENKDLVHWQIFRPRILPNPFDLRSEREKFLLKYPSLDSRFLDYPIHFPIKFEMAYDGYESLTLLLEIRSTTQAVIFSLTEPIKKWVWKWVPKRKLMKMALDNALRIEVPGKGQTVEFNFDAIYRPKFVEPLLLKRAILNYEFYGRTPSGIKFEGGPYRLEIPIERKNRTG